MLSFLPQLQLRRKFGASWDDNNDVAERPLCQQTGRMPRFKRTISMAGKDVLDFP
jgi:hypothetical protein